MSRISDGGHDCILVELIDPKRRRQIWFDPKINFLVRRIMFFQPAVKGSLAEVKTEHVVTRFAEPTAGIFFPEQVEMTSAVDGKQHESRTTVFSEVRINEPLPDGIFDFHFPQDTEVNDTILGKWYMTDANGEPRGEMKDVRQAVAPPIRLPSGEVTTEEPTSWSWWILPASIGMLGVAVGLWLRSKWLDIRGHRVTS